MNAPVPVQKKNERSDDKNSPGEVRVAYPYLHKKRTKNAAGVLFMSQKTGLPNPRYSATFLFPKLAAEAGQCANYMFLWNLAVEAARKMWPTNLDAAGNWTWPVGAQYSVRDGDIPYVSKPKPGVPAATPEEIAVKNAWRKGYWVVEAENFFDPGPKIAKVIGGAEVELPAEVANGIAQYKIGGGGDFAVVNLHAYAYENSTFGVNFGFKGVCFTREGAAIGSSGPRSVSQMFGGIAGTVAPGGAPALPTVAAPPSAPTAPPVTAPSATATAPMPTASAGAASPPMPPGMPSPSLAPAPPGPPLPAFPR